ncbi:hypothetical protein PV10_01610 [Exophiala mesophila]|uniref:Uncharacterized protein n=1 Tax=Exophiala mesophila TaxID=212818 RepID=A0A0D1X7R5_EXOME|nr:uncharacterized protein PV10_01610 [Exophiala mesophila]KIV97910.1 hypothetical protein PV10_01610 [Exophiala mesophila]
MADNSSEIQIVLIVKGLNFDYHECYLETLIHRSPRDPTGTWAMAEIVSKARKDDQPEEVIELPIHDVRVNPSLAERGIRYVLNWELLARDGITSRTINKKGDRQWYSRDMRIIFRSFYVNESTQEVAMLPPKESVVVNFPHGEAPISPEEHEEWNQVARKHGIDISVAQGELL